MSQTKTEVDDLILVQPTEKEGGPKKPVLLRVTKVMADTLFAVVEETRYRTGVTVEVPVSSVVLNLGQKPPPGKAYGYDLSHIFKFRREVAPFGDFLFFTGVTKSQLENLRSGAAEVAKALRKQKLEFMLDAPIDFHVVSKEFAGKWAGMYHHAKDVSKHNHKIEITLDNSRLESSSINSYAYVLAHELGHALHFGWVKPNSKADAAWVRAYTKTVCPIEIPSSQVKGFLETLLRTGSVEAAKSEISEDEVPVWKRVLTEVRTSSGLTPREINLLLEAERPKSVRAAWPLTGLMRHELHPSVTQYALKNYRELFAETFAFWLLGRDIPEDLEALMVKSAQYARSQA